MSSSVADRASAIFLALAQVPSESRALWLTEHCGGDEMLQREVEQLLAAVDDEASRSDCGIVGLTRNRVDIPLAVGTVVGDFTIVGPVGSGATGVVYLARQRHPNRTVALKTLRRGLEVSAARRRFEVEAELLAQLQHPGIAQIYASHPGDERTPPYIAMELVDGPPLTEYAERHELSRFDRIELVARVCDAVQHAHHRGIIHRDLKPPNILVAEGGQPKVLDFGVARVTSSQVGLSTIGTGPGQLVGTLPYMSPEQVQAAPDGTDTRTDVYALGVILFRLLAGRLPFADYDPPLPELGRRIAFDPPPRLSTIDPSLRGDLETIVSRALAKERDRRYTSPAALANDLRRFVDGLPIAASADSAWYVLRKQVARYRRALLASGAVAVALVALVAYATVQRARAARTNIQLEQQLATSNIERGRLASLNGNLPVAEGLVWRELFRQPDSVHARWTLWDLYSREPSLWTRRVNETGTQAIRFSPDGRSLLAGGAADGVIHLLDATSGQLVRSYSAVGADGVWRASFTPDGKEIVSASVDGSLRIWNIESGDLRLGMARLVQGFRDLAIAGNGAVIATVGAAPGVHLWSLKSGNLVTTLDPEISGWRSVAAIETGTLVVAGAGDGMVAAWDLANHRLLWRSRSQVAAVTSLAVDPRGRHVASGGADGQVHLWNPSNGAHVRSLRFDSGMVRSLTFDAYGTTLAATGAWRTRVWDVNSAGSTSRDIGASEGMTDVHVRFDGGALATCDGGNGQVRLWDLAADPGTERWIGHSSPIIGLALTVDVGSLITASIDGVAKWPLDRRGGGASFVPGLRLNTLVESHSRQLMATAGNPSSTAVWDSAERRRVSCPSTGVSGRAAAFSDDDRRVYLGNVDGAVEAWDWGDERAPVRRWPSKDGQILAITAGGSRVFVAHGSRVIRVLDADTGAEIQKLVVGALPFSIALSPDRAIVAAGTTRGVIPLWNAQTGEKLYELKGQTRIVTGIDFSPDGRLLASASRDGTTRLWDVATAQWLATAATRDVGAERVRFFPDGRRVAIGYQDGEVEIRDLDHFSRYVAGQAEYQLGLLTAAGARFPRANEVLEWSRRVSAAPLPAPRAPR